MLSPDLRFNLLMGCVDLVVLAFIWRRPSDRTALWCAPIPASLVPSLALGLSGGGFEAIRLLAWGTFLHGPVLLGGSAFLLFRSHRKFAVALGLAALAVVGVSADAVLVEPRWLEVTRASLTTSKITRPVRIGILSDLQTDVVGPFERRAFRALLAEHPDLILLPGDTFQEPDFDRRSVLATRLASVLREEGLCAPLGVLAVGGNCDASDWPAIFAGLPVTPFVRTGVTTAGELDVTVLASRDGQNDRAEVARPTPDRFHLVFAHHPDFALGAVDADLIIAGHTHGGQVRLPFLGPIVTLSKIPRRMAAGFSSLSGGRRLLVTRGVGMERGEAPRIRFLCRPEVVLIDIVPAP